MMVTPIEYKTADRTSYTKGERYLVTTSKGAREAKANSSSLDPPEGREQWMVSVNRVCKQAMSNRRVGGEGKRVLNERGLA